MVRPWSSAAARDALRLLRRDRLSASAADETRQLELCRTMWWFRHVVVTAAVVHVLVDADEGLHESLLVGLLVGQAVVHVWTRLRPRHAGRAALVDGVVLLVLTAAGLPPVVVLLVVVAVLGWAATFRPVSAAMAYGEALAAVALVWSTQAERLPAGGAVVAFCILGGIFMMRTIRLNIGARRAAEHERLVHERLDAILWERVPGTDAVSVSQATERVLGYPPGTFVRPGFWESIVHQDDVQAGRDHLSGTSDRPVTFRVRHADGGWRWMESRATTIYDRRGREAFVAGVLVDRTPEVEAERAASDMAEQLAHQARHDELTGLPNRRFLLETLQAKLAGGAPGSCALFLLDLDDFKDINDSLGHQTGDQVLLGIGRRITASSPEGLVARLGGDEFAVLVCGLTQDQALQHGRRLTDAVEEPIEVDGLLLKVRVSVGIALAGPGDGQDGTTRVDELLRRADVAMYQAKEHSSSPRCYDTGGDLFSRERVQLSAGLHQAIPNGELLLHFQPLVDVRTGTVTGLEALARWEHPALGLIPPGRFIELAEVSGEIRRITRWAVTTALRALTGLDPACAAVDMSVNLSARTVYEPDFVDWLAAALDDAGVPGERLVLEITEGAVMVDYPAAVAFLEGLRALGVRTWIDDFGTGHSSFARLRHLPVDGVKIDRSFVTGACRSEPDRKLLAGMLSMVRSLGLTTIAEGVEDADSLDLLRDLGCDVAQGYLLGRPAPLPPSPHPPGRQAVPASGPTVVQPRRACENPQQAVAG
jgi:diguanylate cyclase (GGDEF)-like protein/PAS domain S-box-containing protein